VALATASEHTEDIAALLVNGSTFGPQHRDAVLSAVAVARDRRTCLLDCIADEADSLEETRAVLVPLAEEFTDIEWTGIASQPPTQLDAHRQRLDVLEEKCDSLLEDRQSTLVEQRHSLTLPIDYPDIPTYLYQNLDTRYPVVSAVVRLLDRIDAVRGEIDAMLFPSDSPSARGI